MGKYGASTKSVRQRMSDTTYPRAGRFTQTMRSVANLRGRSPRQAVRTSLNPSRSVGTLRRDVARR